MSLLNFFKMADTKQEVKKGYDPKNRLVTLTQKDDKFTVTKEATRFSFTGTEKKATIIYEHQLTCSQN